MSTHLSTEEIIEQFALHCKHTAGPRSYRFTAKGSDLIQVYLSANNPDELIQLAEILSAAAEAWDES
jgi:hypothetical protein